MKNATLVLLSLVSARLISGAMGYGFDRLLDDVLPLCAFWISLLICWKIDRMRMATWVHAGYRFTGSAEDIAEAKKAMAHLHVE